MTTSPESSPESSPEAGPESSRDPSLETTKAQEPQTSESKGFEATFSFEAEGNSDEKFFSDLRKGFVWLLGSFHLCFGILLFMGLITYLGTVAQATMSLVDAQTMYFDSWLVIQHITLPGINFRPGLPLPGGMLLMSLLLVNLVMGGLMRMRISRRNIGVVVTHLGVILLLVAGFIRYTMATEGSIMVWEGAHSSQFQSNIHWEISITTPTGKGKMQRWVIPWKDLADLDTERSRIFRRDELPFEMRVGSFLANADPLQAGKRATRFPVVDGFYLKPKPRDKKSAERNVAGCYLTLMPSKAEGEDQLVILSAREGRNGPIPFTATFEGKPYQFVLRRETYPLPFDVTLSDFRVIYYPRTGMAKSYESDVVIREMVDGEARGKGLKVNISMNQPLRKEGYVLYQSSYGPQQGEMNGLMFSVFSVAKNPSDQVPLLACLVIALGMLMHFIQRFSKWVKKEQKGWTT